MESNLNLSTQVSLQFLKPKIGEKRDLYNKTSRLYYLPSLTCNRVTKNYLKSYILDPCPIFRLIRKDYNPHLLQQKL